MSGIWLLKNVYFTSFLCSKATKECYRKLVACVSGGLFDFPGRGAQVNWTSMQLFSPWFVRITKCVHLSRCLCLADLELQLCPMGSVRVDDRNCSWRSWEAVDLWHTWILGTVPVCFCWNKFLFPLISVLKVYNLSQWCVTLASDLFLGSSECLAVRLLGYFVNWEGKLNQGHWNLRSCRCRLTPE